LKKVAFIDRDGTILVEPPETEQINSLAELFFVPGVISSLKRLSVTGYELIIVTNQDGLGTPSNPVSNYNAINNKVIDVMASENIIFQEIFCCPHTEEDYCDCRKPKIGMLNDYLKSNVIDFTNSIVIGDRQTDMEFADNLGITGYLLTSDNTWKSITDQILNQPRTATIRRKTNETEIYIYLNIDGDGSYSISTGLKYFDHLLEQLAKHSGFSIKMKCVGDLEVDEHHTIEDIAISFGTAFKAALGDKHGIERYAWERILVMDEAKVEISLDLSGRAYFVSEMQLNREYVGDFPTEMFKHFYHSFTTAAGLTLHLKVSGENCHHKIEASFKALAKCLRDATRRTSTVLSSTKGIL
jgi:imidazoleglycerol-phosphate dehydratase / histidinol-phosphatase